MKKVLMVLSLFVLFPAKMKVNKVILIMIDIMIRFYPLLSKFEKKQNPLFPRTHKVQQKVWQPLWLQDQQVPELQLLLELV